MSVVADLKQALHDVLAPEIRANTQAIADLQTTLAAIRNDLASLDQRTQQTVHTIVQSSESRMLESIKAAKTEMLLQLQVSLPTRQVEELKAHPPTQ